MNLTFWTNGIKFCVLLVLRNITLQLVLSIWLLSWCFPFYLGFLGIQVKISEFNYSNNVVSDTVLLIFCLPGDCSLLLSWLQLFKVGQVIKGKCLVPLNSLFCTKLNVPYSSKTLVWFTAGILTIECICISIHTFVCFKGACVSQTYTTVLCIV